MRRSVQFMVLATVSAAGATAMAQESSARPYWFDKPVIEAMGRAEIEVKSNRAAFEVAFVSTDDDAKKAMELAVGRARVAYDAIKKVAGEKSRVQSSVNVQPYYEQYRDREGNVQQNDRPDRVKGYQARVQVSVELTDVALGGRARAAALALGPEESGGGLRVYLEQTAELQRKALEAAAKDAAERAKVTAAATGNRVGATLVVQEGNGPCLGNWSYAQIGRVHGAGDYPYPPPPPPPPPAPMAMMERSAAVASAKIGGRTYEITEADLNALNLPNDERPETLSASVCAVFVLEK